jgi:hypothetical protein
MSLIACTAHHRTDTTHLPYGKGFRTVKRLLGCQHVAVIILPVDVRGTLHPLLGIQATRKTLFTPQLYNALALLD